MTFFAPIGVFHYPARKLNSFNPINLNASTHQQHQKKSNNTTQPFTGVAKRKRDGLITRRSQDRNLSPVLYNSFVLKKRTVIAKRRKTQQPVTGVAQRKRAWLITTRSQDQSLSSVLLHFAPLQKRVRMSTLVTSNTSEHFTGMV